MAGTSFLSIIIMVPTNISTIPAPASAEKDSPRNTNARSMVRTVLLLSIGATLFTSPSWIALK